MRFAAQPMWDPSPAPSGASRFPAGRLCLDGIEEKRAPADAPKALLSGRDASSPASPFRGDLFFWHLSILNTTVANATFFATTAPLFVVLIVWLVLKQRSPGAPSWALLFCLLGGAALIGQSLQVDPARIRGDLFGICTAFFFGLYFLAVEKAREQRGAARVTFEAGVVTAAVLLVVAVLFDTRVIPHTWQGIAALTAMAFISQRADRASGGRARPAAAVFSSLVIFLEAIAAALFGWLILSEALTLVQSLGGALILVGIWAARPKTGCASAG